MVRQTHHKWADEQPLQAHLRDKPAKEPSAMESGTARGSVNSATGCEYFRAAKPHKQRKLTVNKLTLRLSESNTELA